jgi:hypothetical protein
MAAWDKANAELDPIGQLTQAAGRGLPDQIPGVPGNPGTGQPAGE